MLVCGGWRALRGPARFTGTSEGRCAYSVLQRFVQESGELGLGHGTDLGGGILAVFGEHKSRVAADAELCGGLRVVVDIELRNGKTSLVMIGSVIKQRAAPFARTTPFRPIVHQ